MRAESAISAHAERTWLLPAERRRAGGFRVLSAARAGTLPAALVLVVGVTVLLGLVGADARWLAALGHETAAGGRIPAGVPFAVAPTLHWHNVTVLAELIFWGLDEAVGDRGLVLAQAAAVALAFLLVARDARAAGAGPQQTASTCLLAAAGTAPSLVIARAQLFSLALFPALLLLLRSDARRRTHQIWLVPPLLALWGNLHGAVLVGLLVTLVYLAATRARERPLETVALALTCVGALCVNPAGLGAFAYYHGVLTNAAAQRGEGMWGPLSLTSPTDLLLIAAVLLLTRRARHVRPAGWEILVLVVLAGMTIHASRSGIWLVLALITPSAQGTPRGPRWRLRLPFLAATGVATLLLGLVRGPTPSGADQPTIAKAMALAGPSPILASDIPAEQIALAGGRVWASDPIDAFSPKVQVAYLRWMNGEDAGLSASGPLIRVVLVTRGSQEATLMERAPGFRLVLRTSGSELFRRMSTGR